MGLNCKLTTVVTTCHVLLSILGFDRAFDCTREALFKIPKILKIIQACRVVFLESFSTYSNCCLLGMSYP